MKKIFLLFFLMFVSLGFTQNTNCAGTSTEASQETFTTGYNYNFSTSGTSVTVEFELLDNRSGVIAYAWTYNPNFAEVSMSLVSGKKFTRTFTGQTLGSTFRVACKFAFAGGMAVTKIFDYTVGDSCSGGGGLPAPTLGAFTVPAKVLGDAPFTLTPPSSNSSGTWSYTSSNTAVATISGSTLTVVGQGTSTITAYQAATGTYSAGNTTATFTVSSAGAPTVAAPTPPARNSWDVMSLYSGAYTTIPGAVYQHGSDVTIEGNTTRYFSNFLLSRLAFPPTNFSAMTHLHVDIYSLNLNPMWFELAGVRVTKSTPINGWVSLDIPLSEFTGLNLSSVSFFDLNNPTGANPPQKVVYADNIYLYRAATTQPPTLGAFTVPAKVFGDTAFTLTAPTSNSNGAWTFTSSNTSVATISGNTVTIVGVGNSTITATQAADGVYGSGSTTAQLVVSSPPLTVAAPTPPVRVSTDVISVYSNAYTPCPGTRNYNPNWGQAGTVTYETIGADNLLKYSNFNYQGTIIGSNVNASEMMYLHVDIWSPNETSLNFFLVSTANGERSVALTPLVRNSWNSYDIPLTSFTNQSGFAAGTSSIKEFKLEGSGGKTVYVDNMYFWRPDASLIEPTITGFSDIEKFVGDAAFVLTEPESDSDGAFTYISSNPAVATISGSTVTIVGAGTATITATQAETSTYSSGFVTAQLTVSIPPLSIAAPTPPARNAWDVVSLYSDAYATQSSPNWQNASTTTDEQLEGNNTKKMSNFQVELINFSSTDVSQMTTLHLDIYSDDCNALNIWLNNNGDRRAQVNLTLNGWNSVDIPLSTYTEQGLIMSGINLLKFESLNGPGKTVYVDNIYFYRPATLLVPTITDFTVPTKAFGDAPFVLTAPISDSPAAFTYISSNPSVATIIGDTVTITGIGTTTITATQAAVGNFDTGSTSAEFQVTVPAITLNMATANNSVLASFSTGVAAHGYTFAGSTSATYRFMITNLQTGASEEVYSPTRFVTIPTTLRNYNVSYTVTAAAVINGENVPYAGNTITVFSPTISLVKLAPTSCGVLLGSLTSTLTSTVGMNAISYTFRARLSSDNGPTPTYYYVTSANRNTTMSSFVGLIPQYSSSYTIDVQYEFLDVISGSPVQSGYGEACVVTTPGLPLVRLSSPTCGTRVSSMNATVSSNVASHALEYQFRMRLTSDNGSTPTYYYTLPNSSRFSTLGSFQGVSLSYNSSYSISVQYKVLNNGLEVWSGYGQECNLETPLFPVTEITPSLCGLSSTSLDQTLTIVPYPGFPTYRVTLFEQVGESLVPVGSITRTVSNFKLNMFTGATTDKTYSVSVSIQLGGVFGPDGKGCDISTYPASVMRTAVQPLSVVSYPNPFTNGFNLELTTSDKNSSVGVMIYDMLGRQVEQRQLSSMEANEFVFGTELPTGVYNVVVTQAEETRTVRVIKR